MTQPNLSNILHPFRFAKRLLALIVALGSASLFIPHGHAADAIWTGLGTTTNGNWSLQANWDPAGQDPPNGGDNLLFAGTNNLVTTNDLTGGAASHNFITFNAGAGSFTLNGNAVTLDTATMVNNNSTNIQTINLGIIMAVGGTFSTTSNSIVMNGAVSGAFALTKAGAATLFLNASNSYTGLTTISAGALRAANSFALGTTAGNVSVTSGGALELTTNSAGGGISIGAEALTLNGSGTNAAGALRNISGNNIYGGLITLGSASRINSDSGTLSLTNTGAISGATFGLTFGGAGNVSVASIISNTTGGVTKDGAGTLFLTASNRFTGLTTINAGTIAISNNGAFASNNVTFASNGTRVVALTGLQVTNNYNLAGNGTMDVGAFILTNSGIISNTGSLTKQGAGTLILGSANTYRGGTTINAGTVAISNAASFGSNTVTFASNGTTVAALASMLVTNNYILTGNGTMDVGGNIMTNSGVISGAGILTKGGVGTLILSSSNSYSGGTLLNAGTLVAGTNTAFGTNSITISAGVLNLSNFSIANVIVNNGGTVTNVGTVSGAQLNAGTTTLAASNNTVAEVSGTARLDLSGANTTITNVTGGTVNLAATSTNSTLQTVSGGTINASTNITVQTFNGGNISNSSAVTINSGNSSGSISGGGNLIKTGTGTLQLSGNNTYTGQTFINQGVVAISTNAALANTTLINLNNGTALAFNGGTSTTIDRNIAVTNGTAAIVNTGGGTLTLAGALSKNGTVLVFSNGTFNVTGVISGASANSDLVVDNAVVTLSNANTYVGPTFIRNAGTLNAAVVGAMPTATRSALVMDDTGSGNSIFNVTASQQIASLTGAASSSATIATNTSLTIGTTSGNTTFAGAISGGGSLVKDGASTQTLTGNNSYSGGTLVSAGVLAGNTSSLQGNITNNASVVFDQAIDGTYSGSLSGTGSLTKTSAGTLTVTGANTQSGTTITAGALQVGNGGSTGSLSGPITNNASLIFNRSDDALSVGSLISGLGNVVKLGSGTVSLAGNNTYSGATTIGGGVLVANNLANAGSASSFGSGSTIVMSNNGVLRYVGASTTTDRNINLVGPGSIGVSNGTTALTVSGVISNTGSFSKFGQGTLVLSGANTYTGSTTVSAGTLNLNNATGAALGATTNVTVGGGLNAVLLVSQSNQVHDTAAVTLSGGTIRTPGGVSEVFGSLTVTGSGFLDFGATSYATASHISFDQYTPSALLTINNFDFGSTLTFNVDLSSSITNSALFAFNNGGFADYNFSNGVFTITAIPEPSTYLAAAGLLALMLWPSRRRLLRDAQKILGLRAPMRERLEALRNG